MRYNTTQHPLATATKARIDLFTNGPQSVIMTDSLTLAEQSLPHLKRGEHILILNSLASSAVVERAADRLCESTDAKIIAFTACGAKLREKLEFLRLTIIAKNVKLVIVNCWDFAALGSRQKLALVAWMRELRDESGVRIAVYCAGDVTPFGALQLLAWSADTVSKCGDWRTNSEWDSGMMPNANTAADAYVARSMANAPKQIAEPAEKAEILGQEILVDLPPCPLKNKDLAPVRAHHEEETVGINYEEESYALAA